ncbi:hypothetical protein RvY_06024 [Ramazzottius varieornatus]|uniref:Uncharacterized protein n=1 Tax=Ramazzottius varieornatus TaxID=947166 RepID=A0A1D1V5Y7_RAMVA|nr:hypothetical protein RvY_06024 [Ramazzottius varieornatus]
MKRSFILCLLVLVFCLYIEVVMATAEADINVATSPATFEERANERPSNILDALKKVHDDRVIG